MLKTILVPLDGSDLAERALTYATALATPTGARLVLLRAAQSHTLVGVDPRERQVGAIHEAEAYLDGVAGRMREGGVPCETVVPYGHPAECIADQARTRHVDLIVITTHGRTGPGRWIFGSVTEAVVANSLVPVMVLRASQPSFGGPRWSEDPQLLVTLDGSAFAESALEPAASLAEALHGRLVLVRVEDEPARLSSTLEYLPLAQAGLAARHPTLPIAIDIRVGDAAYGIEEAVTRREATLVVMATHGRTGAKRAIVGSVAGKIVQHATVPLVLIRPIQLADESAGPMNSNQVEALVR